MVQIGSRFSKMLMYSQSIVDMVFIDATLKVPDSDDSSRTPHLTGDLVQGISGRRRARE
jgi:hypothetical protein